MRDMQTAGKVDRLKKEFHELEEELRAYKKAIELIAEKTGIEIDLAPVLSDKDIHDAEEILAHPHLSMPTIAEVVASANRSCEKTAGVKKNQPVEKTSEIEQERPVAGEGMKPAWGTSNGFIDGPPPVLAEDEEVA